MKYLALAAVLAVLSSPAIAAPSAIPGQACDVNWVNGACGNSGPLSVGKSEAYPQSPVNRHNPDCDHEKA